VIGLFNWDSQRTASVPLSIGQAGLKGSSTNWVGLDFWSGRLVRMPGGLHTAELPGAGCQILAVAAVADRPQLLGSSRHVTQCFVGLGPEAWVEHRLSGTCELVGGDPTELRILTESTAGSWTCESVKLDAEETAAGVSAEFRQDGELLRVTLKSPASRKVRWSVAFGSPARKP